jgi:cytochrome c biogenesis protein CcmG, thiol:disulfide interchange protein DsbE
MTGRTKLVLQALAVGVVASMIGLLAWQLATKQAGSGLVSAVKRGETPAAPALTLPDLETGEDVSLADYRGKAVVLNFWASWCEPCKDEAPMLEQAWQDNKDRGLVVIGVNAQDFTSYARGFVDKYGITYTNVRDGAGKTRDRWGLTGFPETWWIDRNGRLVAYSAGPFTQDELDANIERALGSS